MKRPVTHTTLGRYTLRLKAGLLLGVLLLSLLTPWSSLVTATGESTSAREEEAPAQKLVYQPFENPPIDTIAPHVLVLDSSRGMKLYSKRSNETIAIPLTGQLMTMALALEKLDLRQRLTLSTNAASKASLDQRSLGFQAGDQIRVDLLLMALHFNNSSVAATAIAEELADSDEAYLSLMREKARELGMLQSTFTKLPTSNQSGQLFQSTLDDTAILLRHVLQNTFYRSLFNERTTTAFNTEKDRHYFFTSPVESTWTVWSDNKVNGSAYSLVGGQETAAFNASNGSYEILILMVGRPSSSGQLLLQTSALNPDVRTLTSQIFDFFTVTTLHRQYQPLNQTITIDNQEIPLISLQTVSYLHPVDAPSAGILDTTTVLDSTAAHLPVTQNQKLGRLDYILSNGTVVSAEFGALQTIYPSNNFKDHLIAMVNTYPSLVLIILILSAILLIIGIQKAIRSLIRYRLHKDQTT